MLASRAGRAAGRPDPHRGPLGRPRGRPRARGLRPAPAQRRRSRTPPSPSSSARWPRSSGARRRPSAARRRRSAPRRRPRPPLPRRASSTAAANGELEHDPELSAPRAPSRRPRRRPRHGPCAAAGPPGVSGPGALRGSRRSGRVRGRERRRDPRRARARTARSASGTPRQAGAQAVPAATSVARRRGLEPRTAAGRGRPRQRSVIVWDAESGAVRTIVQAHPRQVRDADFSPDGKRLLSMGWEGQASLLDLEDGTTVTVPGHATTGPGRRCLLTRTDSSSSPPDWTRSPASGASMEGSCRSSSAIPHDLGRASPGRNAADHGEQRRDGPDLGPRDEPRDAGHPRSRKRRGRARHGADGATFASGGTDGTIRLWETDSGRRSGRSAATTARSTTSRSHRTGRPSTARAVTDHPRVGRRPYATLVDYPGHIGGVRKAPSPPTGRGGRGRRRHVHDPVRRGDRDRARTHAGPHVRGLVGRPDSRRDRFLDGRRRWHGDGSGMRRPAPSSMPPGCGWRSRPHRRGSRADGTLAATGDDKGAVAWDAGSGAAQRGSTGAAVNGVAFAADRRTLFTGDATGRSSAGTSPTGRARTSARPSARSCRSPSRRTGHSWRCWARTPGSRSATSATATWSVAGECPTRPAGHPLEPDGTSW